MNVYEYVVVYRKDNPRSAAAVGELLFFEGSRGKSDGQVNVVIADNPETLKKQVIHNIRLPDGVAIEDVEVLVRPFTSSVLDSWGNPFPFPWGVSNR